MKDAVQCRNCAMVCHKKCESRCQSAAPCSADPASLLADEADEIENSIVAMEAGPEISFTGCEENNQVLDSK